MSEDLDRLRADAMAEIARIQKELRRIVQKLGEAGEWTQAGQYGAKAYQADKYLGDAIDDLIRLVEKYDR